MYLRSFDDITPKNGSEAQKQAIEILLTGADAPFKKNMKPEFIRLAPPLHISPDEVRKFLNETQMSKYLDLI